MEIQADQVFLHVQGSAKRRRPGLVNIRRENCVLLPAAGWRTQFFHLIFTNPGRSLLAEPCIGSDSLSTLFTFHNGKIVTLTNGNEHVHCSDGEIVESGMKCRQSPVPKFQNRNRRWKVVVQFVWLIIGKCGMR